MRYETRSTPLTIGAEGLEGVFIFWGLIADCLNDIGDDLGVVNHRFSEVRIYTDLGCD